MDIWESLSKNLLKWLLGVVAGLMIAGLYGGFKFYSEWKADEAAEDAIKELDKTLMFDTPTQKEQVKDHVEEAVPALEQRLKVERDEDFQRSIQQAIKRQDCLLIRLNDQYYQVKEELQRVHNR